MKDELPTVRAFISYSTADRRHAAQVKQVLSNVSIDGFLAHEDLQISDEWRERIVDELTHCDLFVPLLSANFLKSEWASQEVGFIVSRANVVIAPLSIDGTVPPGFISRYQCAKIPSTGVTPELLVEPLSRRFPRTIVPGLIRVAGNAGSFRSAEALMRPIAPLFEILTATEAQALAEAAVANSQIWLAAQCKTEYLPAFLRIQGDNLNPRTRRALRYQIEHDRWYNPAKNEED